MNATIAQFSVCVISGQVIGDCLNTTNTRRTWLSDYRGSEFGTIPRSPITLVQASYRSNSLRR